MKNAFKSIKRMKIMAFLIVIQLSIGLIMLNSTSSIIEISKQKIDGFSNLFNFEDTTLFRTLAIDQEKWINDLSYKYDQMKYIHEVYEKLDELKEKNIIKRNSIFFSAPINKINGLENHLPNKYENIPYDQKSFYTSTILVNEDFINNYKINIYKGRSFTIEDFDLDYKVDKIPIIIGKDYAETVSIGDEFEVEGFTGNYEFVPIDQVDTNYLSGYSEEGLESRIKVIDGVTNFLIDERTKFKVEVVGIYDNNAIPIIGGKVDIMQKILYSDIATIMPIIKNFSNFNEEVSMYDFGTFIECEDLSKVNLVKEVINPILSEGDLELVETSLFDDYIKVKETLVKECINSLVLGIVLTILSIIGITSVLLGELNERRKEFGIRIACGANLKTLCKEMILEILIMVSISSILSIISLGLKQLIYAEWQYISINTISLNIAVVLILTLLMAIVPILKLRKFNIVDLVKGE